MSSGRIYMWMAKTKTDQILVTGDKGVAKALYILFLCAMELREEMSSKAHKWVALLAWTQTPSSFIST